METQAFVGLWFDAELSEKSVFQFRSSTVNSSFQLHSHHSQIYIGSLKTVDQVYGLLSAIGVISNFTYFQLTSLSVI